MKKRYIVDYGVSLNHHDWSLGNELEGEAQQMGFELEGAGTGFGTRDVQVWTFDKTKAEQFAWRVSKVLTDDESYVGVYTELNIWYTRFGATKFGLWLYGKLADHAR